MSHLIRFIGEHYYVHQLWINNETSLPPMALPANAVAKAMVMSIRMADGWHLTGLYLMVSLKVRVHKTL